MRRSDSVGGWRQRWAPLFAASLCPVRLRLRRRTHRTRWTSTPASRASGAGCGTGPPSTWSPALHPVFPQGDLVCPRKVHSTVKLEFWNAHSPLIPSLGSRNAAQVRTNELWENKKHDWEEHKVFPEELLWDVIVWSSKSHEAQMRVTKFLEMAPVEVTAMQYVWNQSTTRAVPAFSEHNQ